MSDLTTYLHYRRNTLLILIVTTAIIAFLLIRGCQNSRTRLAETTATRAAYDSLVELHRRDSIRNKFDTDHYLALARRASNTTVAQSKIADSMRGVLRGIQEYNRKLIEQRDMYRESLPDSSWVLVHPNFADNCDSCFNALNVTNARIDGYSDEVGQLNALMKYETQIRDDRITQLSGSLDTQRLFAAAFRQLYERESKANKARNKIFLTGSVWSDLMRYGGGGGFTLVTKKDKVWGARVGVFNKQLFYQADFGAKLSLRRK